MTIEYNSCHEKKIKKVLKYIFSSDINTLYILDVLNILCVIKNHLNANNGWRKLKRPYSLCFNYSTNWPIFTVYKNVPNNFFNFNKIIGLSATSYLFSRSWNILFLFVTWVTQVTNWTLSVVVCRASSIVRRPSCVKNILENYRAIFWCEASLW